MNETRMMSQSSDGKMATDQLTLQITISLWV